MKKDLSYFFSSAFLPDSHFTVYSTGMRSILLYYAVAWSEQKRQAIAGRHILLRDSYPWKNSHELGVDK